MCESPTAALSTSACLSYITKNKTCSQMYLIIKIVNNLFFDWLIVSAPGVTGRVGET